VSSFVSRAGLKLDHALQTLTIRVEGFICADFGCNAGGFTDCLLQRGAAKVYAIDTGYGALEWKLRTDPRVVAMERTNAMHVELPESVDLVVIDVAWTRQSKILPSALRVLKADGQVITLIKPHYEADAKLLKQGVLPADRLDAVVEEVKRQIAETGFECLAIVASPILGGKGNTEVLAHLRPSRQPHVAGPVQQVC
jgi:23S rRNA (cytidine1920-2'-O)/16S rRNA (cytidine1409-2'-O)-methyltransferase